jgi:sodium transport system ATP-binding protein
MIEVHALSKRYPLAGGEELLAVDQVSFTVPRGEVYGLLGPNGAGKTTTLRMILGLLEPSDGYAAIDGFRSNASPDEVKRRVGLTVREMLLFFGDIYGVAPEAAALRFDELNRLLGLGEIVDRRCATLSTGQRQRVNLARALIHDPPVMLMDEPTLGLDVLASQVVLEFTAFLRQQGKAVIITTHHLDEAERLCDRFGLLHRGKLVSEGTLDELRERTGCRGLVEMFLKLSQTAPALTAAPAARLATAEEGG